MCGISNEAQVAAALFAHRYPTVVFALEADKADVWRETLGNDDYELTLDTGKVIKSKPQEITTDPSILATCRAIVLIQPAHAHRQYLKTFRQHAMPGALVVTAPTRCGQDLIYSWIMKKKADDCTFVGIESIPWTVKVTEPWRKAKIRSRKREVLAAVRPQEREGHALATLHGLFGIRPIFLCPPNFLSMSLRSPSAILNPALMYGRWCSEVWDGRPVPEKPLFYQGVDDFTVRVLMDLTGEVQAIRAKLEELIPGLDLRLAVGLKQWHIDSYAKQIADASSLRTCLCTNAAYKGIQHSCKQQQDAKFMPNLKGRHLAEDIPTGLCFIRGLGEILQVPMPMADKVLTWAQGCLGISVLVDGRLTGKDVSQTRAPQATDVKDLEGFLAASKIDRAALSGPTSPIQVHSPTEQDAADSFCAVVAGSCDNAQVAAALCAQRVHTVVISLSSESADRWRTTLGNSDFELLLETGSAVTSRLDSITSDPKDVAQADLVLLTVPPSELGQYLAAFAPHLRREAVVVIFPAHSGCDLIIRSSIGQRVDELTFLVLEEVPWSCSIVQWGREARITSRPSQVLAVATPSRKFPEARAQMQGLLGIRPAIIESPSLLGLSLRNATAVLGPGLSYRQWCPEKLDCSPVREAPPLYRGLDESSVALLLRLSDEVQAVRNRLVELAGVDLRHASDLRQRYADVFAVVDDSSLQSVRDADTGLMHDFASGASNAMDLSESIVMGMCFNKGLGELLGLPMPVTERILTWAQKRLNLELLIGGRMVGRDVAQTRAPQASGITTLQAFFEAAAIPAICPRPGGPAQEAPVFRLVLLRNGESVWDAVNNFSGWSDVGLSAVGESEAAGAGRRFNEEGLSFDVVFTSVLRRSIKTAWISMMNADCYSMPVISTWRLNGKHYGALQGINRVVASAEHGNAQVRSWRSSYEGVPPQLKSTDLRHPAHDPLYGEVPPQYLPAAESFRQLEERMLPFWFDTIGTCVKSGQNVLIVSHGGALRAICKHLERLQADSAPRLIIPRCVPLVYELDSRLRPVRKYTLSG